MLTLANTQVIIIGASQGLGFQIAAECVREGAFVTICSRSEDKLRKAVERLDGGNHVVLAKLDVLDEEQVKAFFAERGQFDHLVYTASGTVGIGYPNVDLTTLRSSFDIFYWGMLSVAKHARGYVTQSITTSGGNSALRPGPGLTVTAGLGGAAIASSRGLALEMAPVRVNCVAPGVVDTEFWDREDEAYRRAVFEKSAQVLPVRRVGTVEEVAEAYIFCMKCGYLTGQTISPDGGYSIMQ